MPKSGAGAAGSPLRGSRPSRCPPFSMRPMVAPPAEVQYAARRHPLQKERPHPRCRPERAGLVPRGVARLKPGVAGVFRAGERGVQVRLSPPFGGVNRNMPRAATLCRPLRRLSRRRAGTPIAITELQASTHPRGPARPGPGIAGPSARTGADTGLCRCSACRGIRPRRGGRRPAPGRDPASWRSAAPGRPVPSAPCRCARPPAMRRPAARRPPGRCWR